VSGGTALTKPAECSRISIAAADNQMKGLALIAADE